MSSTVEGLERGVVGTRKTLDKMHHLVALGKLDPTMQKIATWIRLQVPQDVRGKTKATADAIFDWVEKHGVFQSDPFQIEKIEHPIETMRPVIEARQAGTYTGPGIFAGDCDSYSVITATLGGILGFQYAFETAKVDADRPDEFSHVWTALLVDGDWYPLDSSTPGVTPGWRPPIAPEMFARWPESPIENVIKGSDMSSWNARRSSGMGDNVEPVDEGRQTSPLADVDTAYPKDDFYGIPKDFGGGPGVIPPGNFDDLQLLQPHSTQIPAADLQPDMRLLKAAPTVDPSERIQSLGDQPDDHGNPYYRGAGAQPYYKVERQFYPPGSRWNGKQGLDSVRYVRTNNYVSVKSPETPERKVEVQMGQPMTIRRRSVMTQPQRIPYGAMSGMGDDTFVVDTPSGVAPDATPAPDTTVTTSLPGYNPNATPTVQPTPAAKSTPNAAAAASAGGSVWDAVSSVFKAAGSVAPSVMQSNIAQTIAKATNMIAGRQVVAVGTAVPWYKDPWLLGLSALALGGGAYVVYKMRPGLGGRRRRR
jgi:hypothetical protein